MSKWEQIRGEKTRKSARQGTLGGHQPFGYHASIECGTNFDDSRSIKNGKKPSIFSLGIVWN